MVHLGNRFALHSSSRSRNGCYCCGESAK